MMRQLVALAGGSLALAAGSAFGGMMTLHTAPDGDCEYYWNSKYSGQWSYTTGQPSAGIYLYFGAPYGNDHTVVIFEVPIAPLAGLPLTGATLQFNAPNGFDTNYFYGQADMGWLDVDGATGDVVADGMGVPARGRPGEFDVWDSDWGLGSMAGLHSYDVLTCVQADLAAGRTHSTFVLHGSRETFGGISTAESGQGPAILATYVPAPGAIALAGLAAVASRRRR
jgi:hypothetical protein